MPGPGPAAAAVPLLPLLVEEGLVDGAQLGVEVAGLERARDNLNAEVARLTTRVDAMDTVEAELETLKKAYVATEQKYQTMLTVSGSF